jgi:hypothetical protein
VLRLRTLNVGVVVEMMRAIGIVSVTLMPRLRWMMRGRVSLRMRTGSFIFNDFTFFKRNGR